MHMHFVKIPGLSRIHMYVIEANSFCLPPLIYAIIYLWLDQFGYELILIVLLFYGDFTCTWFKLIPPDAHAS